MLSRTLAMTAELITPLTQPVNDQLKGYSPATIIAGTLAAVYLLKRTYYLSRNLAEFAKRNWPSPFFNKKQWKKTAAQALHNAPILGPEIQKEAGKELKKLSDDIQKSVDKHRAALGAVHSSIPAKGQPKEFIHGVLSHATEEYKKHLSGRVSGMMYVKENKEYNELLDQAFSLTKFTNPMHDEEFPLIDKMTAEVLAMSQTLFNGDPKKFNSKDQKKLAGLITDGGTSSIMEACSAYVLHAKAQGISEPEIIIPVTAHVSFKNAAKRFGAKLIEVPVDPVTGKADVKAMEKAITKNTCMMVGSAPSFPCGVFDPIKELAAVASQHKVPLHVDACLGGFLFPFAKKAGYKIPECDFSIPGVMSISADPHKYGQTPKGSSVLLFHPDNPASGSAIFTDLKWTGGMYVSQGMKGSRPGHVVATTWTAMMYHGEEGYTAAAKNIMDFTKKLSTEIAKVEGIRLLYPTDLSVIAIGSDDAEINPYVVSSRLKKARWNLNTIQKPPGFHFCITAAHQECQDMILREFIKDLREAVQYAKEHPFEKPSGTAEVYGMLPEVPDFMEGKVGETYAAIHNSLSPEQLEREFKFAEPEDGRRELSRTAVM